MCFREICRDGYGRLYIGVVAGGGVVIAVVEMAAGGGVLGHTGIHGRLGSWVSMPFE